jgi:hypothetical protein
MPFFSSGYITGLYMDWGQAKYELLVIHADSAGRTIRSYRNADFALQPGPVQGQLALTETAGKEILFSLYEHGVYVFDPARAGVFKRHPLLPSKGYYFSKDKAGNLLAYQIQPADPAEGCYLITAKGQLLDYSWVFEHQVILYPVFSDDFTAGMLAGSGNGFNIFQLRPERVHFKLSQICKPEVCSGEYIWAERTSALLATI